MHLHLSLCLCLSSRIRDDTALDYCLRLIHVVCVSNALHQGNAMTQSLSPRARIEIAVAVAHLKANRPALARAALSRALPAVQGKDFHLVMSAIKACKVAQAEPMRIK